ncbi:putative leucine-rich repeat domain superfamily, F-box-like domain superfamily [Helianthus debilis subsp. tardiflorus]
MDLISQLPESIVHRILSLLVPLHTPPTDFVRVSVLSKTWFHLTASYPHLDFTIRNFTHVSRESFFKYIEYTTSRFCHQNLTAYTLRLITDLRESAELDIVNRCLELLLQNGVFFGYRSLTRVPINDEVLKHITTSCPLLQVFVVNACHGLKRFCVYGHQHLRSVWIQYNTPFERIDIEAPNLSSLSIKDDHGRGGPPQMNLASCEKLITVFYYVCPYSNSYSFIDLLSNFPFVENLILATTNKCNNLKLSSHSLRTLVLKTFCDLEQIKFNAPNLVSFSYSCCTSGLMSLSMDKRWAMLRDSSPLKGCMHCYPASYIDTVCLWFQKLRHFLDKKNGFKVFNLYIHAIYSPKFRELEKLKEIKLPPYELELVELQLETHEESQAHIAFVDAVLWCCRPRTLTLRSFSPLTALEEHSDVVKFTYKKLLAQEDQGHTNIQIVSPSFSSLLMALPHVGKAISFIKEKVLQEEADSQRFAGLEIV